MGINKALHYYHYYGEIGRTVNMVVTPAVPL